MAWSVESCFALSANDARDLRRGWLVPRGSHRVFAHFFDGRESYVGGQLLARCGRSLDPENPPSAGHIPCLVCQRYVSVAIALGVKC